MAKLNIEVNTAVDPAGVNRTSIVCEPTDKSEYMVPDIPKHI